MIRRATGNDINLGNIFDLILCQTDFCQIDPAILQNRVQCILYNSLQRQNPEKAARLFAKNESEAKARYAYLNKLVAMYGEEE